MGDPGTRSMLSLLILALNLMDAGGEDAAAALPPERPPSGTQHAAWTYLLSRVERFRCRLGEPDAVRPNLWTPEAAFFSLIGRDTKAHPPLDVAALDTVSPSAAVDPAVVFLEQEWTNISSADHVFPEGLSSNIPVTLRHRGPYSHYVALTAKLLTVRKLDLMMRPRASALVFAMSKKGTAA